jgi:curli biogenesis system outer membrane secretion channel CsgG
MKKIVLLALSTFLISACSIQETSRSLPVAKVSTSDARYSGEKTTLAIGKFDNRSSYLRGLFFDGVDRLGGQAKTILLTHLQQSNYFKVVERENLAEIAQEAKFNQQIQNISGAHYVVVGDVTEFGRKEVGDQQFFGILGRGKTQVAYAKVNLNIVNVQTSQVDFSVQGAGEYTLSNREVVGFGSTSSYDSTLNGKVLDLAIRGAVNNLVAGIQNGRWKPAE